MGWEFRVVKKTNKTDYLDDPIITYGIHQVFLDENQDIVRIEDNPIFFDENLDNLKFSLEKMVDCCELSVINYSSGEEL